MNDSIKATCPACHSKEQMTAVVIKGGTGKLVWECGRCGEQHNPEAVESATARIANRRIIVPKTLGELAVVKF